MNRECHYFAIGISCMVVMNFLMLESLESSSDKYREQNRSYVKWKVFKLSTDYISLDITEKILTKFKDNNDRMNDIKNNKHKLEKETDGHWNRITRMNSTGNHSFNETVSDLIGIRRDIMDTRKPACKTIQYNISQYPDTSVVIIFHNEAWSTLLRTVHSILDRTPAVLIREIILVDDASSYDWLKQPLTDYFHHFKKVKIIRLHRRSGLIKARLRGAKEATGEVLYFADGHTECNVGWLEPLLSRIMENRKVLTIPNIDPIDWKSLDYLWVSNDYHGAFDWNLVYFYKVVPDEVLDAREDETQPIPCPAMVGCAHAIDRKYFFESGAYDEHMEIWGGENVEHSFRLWMCGGRVEIIPCSKIGHIFKPMLPYSMGIESTTVVRRNFVRLAEVWMDDYKKFYYATLDELPPLDLTSLYKRKKLREELNCKNFDWYMNNIIPEMPIPPLDAVHFGKVTLKPDSDKCIIYDKGNDALRVDTCETHPWRDTSFTINAEGHFRFGNSCIGIRVLEDDQIDINANCSSQNSLWIYDPDLYQLHLKNKNVCLQPKTNTDAIVLKPCNTRNEQQKWEFELKFNFTRRHNVIKTSLNQQKIPRNALRFGSLINLHDNYCLNIGVDGQYEMIPCSEQASFYKIIHLDKDGKLTFKDQCMTVSEDMTLEIDQCQPTTENQSFWSYDSKTLQLSVQMNNRTLCMTFSKSISGKIYFAQCDQADLHQAWNL